METKMCGFCNLYTDEYLDKYVEGKILCYDCVDKLALSINLVGCHICNSRDNVDSWEFWDGKNIYLCYKCMDWIFNTVGW